MLRPDEFVRSVEARLRCPAERGPAVIEELRGHLADRVGALMQKGVSESDAERQAVREMGAAWLLALRLSAANGWSVVAHVLRELWAAGVGFEVAVGCLLLASVPINSPRPLETITATRLANIGLVAGAALALLATFGFAMARVVRGWVWATVPAIASLYAAPISYHGGPVSTYAGAVIVICVAAAVAVIASAARGQRRGAPRLAWLAWACAGALVAWVLVYGTIWAMTSWSAMSGGPYPKVSQAVVVALRDLVSTNETPLALTVLAGSWLLWLAAWVIERVGNWRRGAIAG